MKFSEAMKALEEGKKVRREDWNEGCFVYVLNDSVFDEKGSSRSIYLSAPFLENWELYEEPVKTYSFIEAVQLMKEGKTIKRKYWGSWYSMRITYDYTFKFTTEDIEATDWMVE